MPSNSYDLIVVGDDLPGLVAGTLCARRGMRTLILGAEEHPARYSVGPFKLPIEPLLWPSRTPSAADRILQELALDLAMKRKFRDDDQKSHVVADDIRFALAEGTLDRELARERGAGLGQSWIDGWARIDAAAAESDPWLVGQTSAPGVGFFEGRRVARNLAAAERHATGLIAQVGEALGRDHDLMLAVAEAVTRSRASSGLAKVRGLANFRAGAASIRGDYEGLRELLLERLANASGEVRIGRIDRIVRGWRRLTSVVTERGEELGAGQVIWGRSPESLASALGDKVPKKLRQLVEHTDIKGFRYTLNLVVEPAGIPAGIGATTVVLGDRPVTIHLAEADDAGRVVVSLCTTLTVEASTSSEDQREMARKARREVLAQVDDVLPFVDRHVVLAHSPHDGAPPTSSRGTVPYDPPRGLPVAMRQDWLYVGKASGPLPGVPANTGLRNLALMGTWSIAELGVEGDLITGYAAARRACAIARKRKDYLRDETVSK